MQGLEECGCGGGAQVVVSLWHRCGGAQGPEGGAEGKAQVGRAPEEVVARPLEKLKGGKPRWQKSSPGKEGARVASQRKLSHGKSKCGFPRDTGHQHEGERDDLGKNSSG